MSLHDDIKELARSMVEKDIERDKAFSDYQNMYHSLWRLPAELEKLGYIHKGIATDPHDAIEAGKRVLSSIMPKPKITPVLPTPEQKAKASEDERNLRWQLETADRRKGRSTVADVVLSALLYDAVALNVIDLDYQIAQAKALNARTKRMEAARRKSRFVVNVFNPTDVHVNRSSYGIENVLLCQRRKAREVMDEWGDIAKKMQPLADAGALVEYWDFWDYDARSVWVSSLEMEGAIDILKASPHECDFLPWAAVVGGSSLEDKEQHKYHPLLYSIRNSGAWETMNILMTIMATDAIIKMFKPEIAETGANIETSEQDFTDPTGILKVKPGNAVQQLTQQPVDPAKLQVYDKYAAQVQQSTVSQVLMGGGIPPGMAYATLNLTTQTALGALKPAKELSEKALAEGFILMLDWTRKTGKPLEAYGTNPRKDLGQRYVINPDEIDEQHLYLTVELSQDVPTDRMQRANVAGQMIQWGYPVEMALEDLGVEDPEQAINAWYYERLKRHVFEMNTQAEMMQMQGEVQSGIQAQAEQQAEAQALAMQAQNNTGIPGGQPFNPAMGGLPPAMANPDITREMMTGEDEMGLEAGAGGLFG